MASALALAGHYWVTWPSERFLAVSCCFSAWFRKQAAAAGLPDTCVPHGVRKAGCRIMAESDCIAHEIMSVSGHSSLKEVERYTRDFGRKRLARAQAKVAAANNVVPLAVVAER